MQRLLSFIFCAVVALSVYADDHTIQSVEQRGSWYYLYDINGKRYHTLSTSNGELMGWSSTFFILRKGSWYYLYDSNGKRYHTLSTSNGDFQSIAGNQFILRRGSWLYVYDKSGRRLSTRSAR